MNEDSELLRRYVRERSQQAFAELVRRHLGFVYGVAAIRLQDQAHLAADVAQLVFLSLARKAPGLLGRASLAGWLHTATRFAALDALRTERRRQARELEAMRESPETEMEWDRIGPLISEALDRLPARDREAVLLRYFQDRPYAEIGAMLNVSENAARKCVDYALQRLRAGLRREGIVSTTAALAASLASRPVMAAPAGLEASILNSASAVGPIAGGKILYVMATTKSFLAGTGLLGAAALLALLLLGVDGVRFRSYLRDRATLASRRQHDRRDSAAVAASKPVGSDAAPRQSTTRTQARDAQRVSDAGTALRAARAPRTTEAWRQLVTDHPEVAGMMRGMLKAEFDRDYRVLFLSGELTATQQRELEDRTLAYDMDNVGYAPGSLPWPTAMQLPDEQLQAILGDEGYRELKSDLKLGFGNLYAIQIATAAGYSGAPLSAEQEVQIAQLVADNSQQPAQARASFDWKSIEAVSQKILTPAQWEGAEPLYVARQYYEALTRAEQQAQASVPEGAVTNRLVP